MIMETTKQQISSKGLRRSTLRKSVATDKVRDMLMLALLDGVMRLEET